MITRWARAAALVLLAAACATAASPFAGILSNLTNPVFQRGNWSTKDAAMLHDQVNARYILAFSAFSTDTGPTKPTPTTISHVVAMSTKDFVTFEELFWISGHAQGWIGMCSPNFTPINSTYWIMTFNSWGDEHGKANQLFYLTSSDLASWKHPGGRADPPYHPLAETLTRGVRAIDAAVAPVTLANGSSAWLLAYKRVQSPVFALAPADGQRGLDGPFRDVQGLSFSRADGKLDGADHENWDFLVGPDGLWRAVSSDYGFTVTGARTTWLYTQAARGDFSKWVNGYPIPIPESWFNNDDRANAGAVSDWRHVDGVGAYVLVFAGNTEQSKHEFAGRGHNRLGLATSTDLQNWEALPPSPAPPLA